MEGCRGVGVMGRPRGEGESKNFLSKHFIKTANEFYSLFFIFRERCVIQLLCCCCCFSFCKNKKKME